MPDFVYPGSELDLFREGRNWKSYWSSQVRPFLKGDILEVGAGIGSNIALLDPDEQGSLVCLEPDRQLANQLSQQLAEMKTRRTRKVVCGTLSAVADQRYDTIAYIDVLEHIEEDRQELVEAARLLRPGGRIVVLSPALQSLFSPFDTAIGHFRRYDRPTIQAISPPGLSLSKLIYLDSVGVFASLANRLFLRQSMPTPAQIAFWDGWIVPVSRVADKLVLYSVGKTILAVWQKPAGS